MNNTGSQKILTVTSNPHVKSPVKTHNIMADVIIALLPALAWSVYIFGLRALTVTLVSTASCIVFEYLYRLIMKKNNTTGDLSAAVTGILLAFTLPVSVPLWMPVLGAFFAIVIVKQLYGGIGKNVVNPALAARVFLFIAFPTELTTYTFISSKLPAFELDVSEYIVNIQASATPLMNLKEGIAPQDTLLNLLYGNCTGCIGEVSALLLIVGGVYLMIRKVISWHIPVTYIATVAILCFIFPAGEMTGLNFMLYEILTGGLMLGAFFMATDYVTSPITNIGRIIFGVGCGLITVFIRLMCGYPEGVSFAILIMNLFVWYIDKCTKPKNFGGGKKHEAK